MTKFIVPALSLLAITAPAFAEKQTPVTFTRDGERFEYIATENNGVQDITGTIVSTGEDFRLRVANGKVSGEIGGREVNFSLSDVSSNATLAAR